MNNGSGLMRLAVEVRWGQIMQLSLRQSKDVSYYPKNNKKLLEFGDIILFTSCKDDHSCDEQDK